MAGGRGRWVCLEGRAHLAGLVVLQPALQVCCVGPGPQAASLQGQDVAGPLGARRHHRVEGVVQGGRVAVGPLVLRTPEKHTVRLR